MKTATQTTRHCRAFSLGEMLAALVIGAIILTTVLSIYGRASSASEAVAKKIDSPALGSEVLQLIAQDIDKMTTGTGATVELKNGFDHGLPTAQLTLRRSYYDGENKEQTFAEITWRTGYDYEGGGEGLVIYRSYSGLAPEDGLLDRKRKASEADYPLVPICRGVTYFRVEITNGEISSEEWSGSYLPPGMRIGLSFAQPFETVQGTLDVQDTEKTQRIVAVNRIRSTRFSVTAPEDDSGNDAQEQPQLEP